MKHSSAKLPQVVPEGRAANLSVTCITRPILLILKYCYGIYVTNVKKLTIWQKIHSYLGLAVTVIWFVAQMAIYVDLDGKKLVLGPFMVSELGTAMQIMTTVLVLLRRRRQVHRLLQLLADIQRAALLSNGISNMTAIMKSYVIAKWLIVLGTTYVVVMVVINIVLFVVLEMEMKFSLRSITYAINFGSQILAPLIHVVIYLYLFTCHVLNTALKNIENGSDDVDHGIRRGSCRRNKQAVVDYHKQICDSVRAVDSVFGELIFVWSVTEFANVLVLLRNMNLHLPTTNFTLVHARSILSSALFFGLINTSAGNVNGQITDSLTGVFPLDQPDKPDFVHRVHTGEDARVKLYIRKVQLEPPVISGWSLHTPSSWTLYTAATYILSYVLVLYRIPEVPNESITDPMSNGSRVDLMEYLSEVPTSESTNYSFATVSLDL